LWRETSAAAGSRKIIQAIDLRQSFDTEATYFGHPIGFFPAVREMSSARQ
jgi:hypothetical protein